VQRNVGSRPWKQLGSARTMPMAAEHSPVLNTERVYRVGCSKIVGQTQHDPKNEGMNVGYVIYRKFHILPYFGF
jgi:hypothetical protein